MKKWILLTAALCCLLALAGCGSVQDADGYGSETEAPRADILETDSSIEDVSGADVGETDSPVETEPGADVGEADSPVETDVAEASKLDAIPFEEGQLYGVAYLGYEEIEDLSFYAERYLDDENPPIHFLSEGEYYLVIPRYADMEMRLYRNDVETQQRTLVYEDTKSRPFLVQCNVSDIFPDATICLTWQGEAVEFSPYISLMDGSVEPGERGLDLTRPQQ